MDGYLDPECARCGFLACQCPQDDAVAFAAFWCAWPKKVKRLAARDAFRWAMDHHDKDGRLLTRMLAAIRRQTAERSARYLPDPDKWLLGARWLDDPLPAAPPTPAEVRAYHDWIRAVGSAGIRLSLTDFVERRRSP